MTNLIDLDVLKDYLEINSTDFDDRLNAIIGIVSDHVQSYTKRSFITETRTELIDGGGYALETNNFPIVEITEIIDNFSNATAVDTDSYRVDKKSGLIYRGKTGENFWPAGHGRWEITYSAGFGSTTSDLPGDIVTACLQMAALQFDNPDSSVLAETIGDRRVQRSNSAVETGMPPSAMTTLNRYKTDGPI